MMTEIQTMVDGRTGAKSGEVFLVGRTEITWEVGGRTADGRTGAKSGEVFFGQTEGRTADKKRSKNLILGLPDGGYVGKIYRMLMVLL